MVNRNRKPHYIREWRKKRDFSLRRLADRLEKEPGGDQLISYASLGRIETFKQPYSQEILEALAVALNVSKAALLEMDPTKDGEVVDLVRRLDERRRVQALEYLRFLASQ